MKKDQVVEHLSAFFVTQPVFKADLRCYGGRLSDIILCRFNLVSHADIISFPRTCISVSYMQISMIVKRRMYAWPKLLSFKLNLDFAQRNRIV